ncbi:sensor histidine kinase [Nonomuraea ceibae]|uniref:sensor histidine kinase n=1 Tax=Nonomuraea ceibae TaxID=1935170 RepID=UPI001C5F611B|nr:histidine kinase dimerization/phosphoacceptor domain-containing protein [Nonomuraea ceibae]
MLIVVILLVVVLAETVTWLAWPSMITMGDPGMLAAACALAVALLLVRRRWPALALVAAALLFGRFLETGVVLAVIAYGTARASTRPVVWVLAGIAPLSVALLLAPQTARHQVAVVMVTTSLICLAVPALLGLVLIQRERLVSALQERNTVLEHAQELTSSRARLLERSRIAQEMHDLIGHRLSLICLYAGGLELSAAPPLAERAQLVREAATTAMNELRAVLRVLRSGCGELTGKPTEITGTRTDMERLVEESRAAGARVDLTWSGQDTGPDHEAVRAAAHRLVRA